MAEHVAKPRFDVAEELARLPAQPLAALRVLQLAEDPNASSADLGRLVEMDPALSARVMRVANAPYYGLRTSVYSASRAVVLLGFSTVKAVAAAAACGLLVGDVTLGPPDFWAHSVSVAGSASVAADALGVARGDAFSAGLLHDIGTALLHRSDPAVYEAALAGSEPGGLLEAEQAAFDLDHATAGAEALEIWQFPRPFVEAIRAHHEDVATVNPLAQAIILGQVIAERIDPMATAEELRTVEEVADDLGLEPSVVPTLISRAEDELYRISRSVGAGL